MASYALARGVCSLACASTQAWAARLGRGPVALDAEGSSLSRFGELQQQGAMPQSLVGPITARLAKMRIELVKGTVVAGAIDPLKPHLAPGSLSLSDTDRGELAVLDFGAYVPAFSQGPNTGFLPAGALDEQRYLSVDAHLHSTVFKGIFGVNVVPPPPPERSHPSLAIAQSKADACAENASRLVLGEPLVPYDPYAKKVGPFKLPSGAYPIRIHIGHGKGGYLYWSDLMQNEPMCWCCCQPCEGGFPFCPPPCCWCCAPGCSMVFGYCCGQAASEGASMQAGHGMHDFGKSMGVKGLGKGPPDAAEMER